MTRKRQRKEPIGDPITTLVPIVDDEDTLRLDAFPSFDLIGTESVLGKMGSLRSLATQPSLMAPQTISALVPVSAKIEPGHLRVRTADLTVGIASRFLVETNVCDIHLSKLRIASDQLFTRHVYPTTNSVPIESLWESYQSFVNELVFGESPCWGLMEIPRLGMTNDWVYVQREMGGKIFLVASFVSDKNFVESVRAFGVSFEVVENEGMGKENEETSDDEEEGVGKRCYLKIESKTDVFGFFDFFRSNLILKLISAAKSGSRNRWPLLSSNCTFRHSCVVSPNMSVRRGQEGTRFIELDGLNCPIYLVERFVNTILKNEHWVVKVTVKEKELFEMFNKVRLAVNSPPIVELIPV
jgi:hypothetical protein